nr:GGDEF domain-containing protein [Chromobacterium sp. ASV5]
MRDNLEGFQSLIDTIQGALVLVSPEQGLIRSANQLACILLACPHGDLIGQDFYQFIDGLELAREIDSDIQRGNMVYNRGLRMRTAIGRPFEVQLSARKVTLGDAQWLAFSFQDRTEAKVMSQLLDFEHQLVERSLNIVRTLQAEGNPPEEDDKDDKLTGVAGRHRLLAIAHSETGRARRYGGQLSSLVLELVNLPDMTPSEDDGSARNHLVRLAGSLCLQSTRDSDLVARQAAGTFVILLPHTPLSGANELGRRLIRALRQLTFVYQGQEHQAAACVGISALRIDESAPMPMLGRLEQALARARERGANYIIRRP